MLNNVGFRITAKLKAGKYIFGLWKVSVFCEYCRVVRKGVDYWFVEGLWKYMTLCKECTKDEESAIRKYHRLNRR